MCLVGIGVNYELARIYNHLGDGRLCMPGKVILATLMELERPAHCEWHHSMAKSQTI